MVDADEAAVVRGDDQADEVDRDPYRDLGEGDIIIELRTHGVSGTPPESMLSTTSRRLRVPDCRSRWPGDGSNPNNVSAVSLPAEK
jgi:hypothetical protein